MKLEKLSKYSNAFKCHSSTSTSVSLLDIHQVLPIFFYKHIPNCWKVSTAQDFPYSMSQKHICLFFGFFYIPIIFSHVVINLPLSNNNFYLHIINQNVFIYTKPRSTSDCPWESVIIIS